MTRLRLVPDAPWEQGYSSGDVVAWVPGEVREVPDHIAIYLTSTYPALFIEHREVGPEPDPAEAPTPPSPPARRRRGG